MQSAEVPVAIDERTRAGLARLTENEKQGLRRRLLPQTAKEMAIDLGISPHAVEKRLKMARAKLGLSSSLEAARLLVALERYDRTVPQEPALALPGDMSQALFREEAGSSLQQGGLHRNLFWTICGGTMLIILAIALTAGPQATQDPPAEAATMRKASL
jgi:DNA-binding CsgD family transcriptional regulator